MPRVTRWLVLWCPHCHHMAQHECLPDVPDDDGLLWRCDRCRRAVARTYTQLLKGQRA